MILGLGVRKIKEQKPEPPVRANSCNFLAGKGQQGGMEPTIGCDWDQGQEEKSNEKVIELQNGLAFPSAVGSES